MNSIFAELLTLAKKVTNYAIDATTPTAYWISTTIYRAVCPVGKRWFFIGGAVNADASATVLAEIRNAATAVILPLQYKSVAGTGISAYPNTTAGNANLIPGGPVVIDAGEYVQLTFGAAQGAGAFATCNVLEVDV